MRFSRFLCLSLALLFASPAAAGIVARVDNRTQTIRVFVDGVPAYLWPVSTARPGYRTPAGRYRVQRMERVWYSQTYGLAPMPYSLFFHRGYAIHGTSAVGQLGRPASHGCVRLSPGHARTLFDLARWYGGAQVIVTN